MYALAIRPINLGIVQARPAPAFGTDWFTEKVEEDLLGLFFERKFGAGTVVAIVVIVPGSCDGHAGNQTLPVRMIRELLPFATQ